MIIQTLQFGELEVQPESVISFEHGLPGFESLHRFTVVTPDPEVPFSFLQSVDDGDVAFVLTNPFLFYPDYEFDIPEEVRQQLRIGQENDVAVWSIVSIRDDLATSSLNLLAPLLINVKERLGRQCILHGSGYTTKHPLSARADTDTTAEVGEAHARIDS
ncbi:flagellar assembly protein FliW [Paenibacillus flagellatus]|uniref:Flagellar assembly factor FliW n=1 Tax=Paenibacillus flagellatus TaxID=2211139 RepID=A0A2V5JWK9_9BACL|nr:flagellar assembly protein FliW [Paenibacillus flagellatus]PYI51179.1 flagellar assembly protein FliW [Paenibacillus flagellatus]